MCSSEIQRHSFIYSNTSFACFFPPFLLDLHPEGQRMDQALDLLKERFTLATNQCSHPSYTRTLPRQLTNSPRRCHSLHLSPLPTLTCKCLTRFEDTLYPSHTPSSPFRRRDPVTLYLFTSFMPLRTTCDVGRCFNVAVATSSLLLD